MTIVPAYFCGKGIVLCVDWVIFRGKMWSKKFKFTQKYKKDLPNTHHSNHVYLVAGRWNLHVSHQSVSVYIYKTLISLQEWLLARPHRATISPVPGNFHSKLLCKHLIVDFSKNSICKIQIRCGKLGTRGSLGKQTLSPNLLTTNLLTTVFFWLKRHSGAEFCNPTSKHREQERDTADTACMCELLLLEHCGCYCLRWSR